MWFLKKKRKKCQYCLYWVLIIFKKIRYCKVFISSSSSCCWRIRSKCLTLCLTDHIQDNLLHVMVDVLARLPDFCRNSGNIGHTVCRVQDLGVVQASWPSGHWLPLHHQLHLLHRRVPVQRLLRHHLWHRLLLVHLLQGMVKIYHWSFNTQSTTTDKAGQILGRDIIRVLTSCQPWQFVRANSR